MIRRLAAPAARRQNVARVRPPLAAVSPPPRAERVDDAELDQLRAELVRELDNRAAHDGGGSATFRRVA